MRIVLQPAEAIAQWVCARAGASYNSAMTAVGLVDDEEQMLAAACFDDYTGRSIAVHLAVIEPTALKALIRLIGTYAFEQLGCSRLTLMAEESNLAATSLHKRLGAIPEGTLVGASRSGDNILISRLEREGSFWRRFNGRQGRWGASSAGLH